MGIRVTLAEQRRGEGRWGDWGTVNDRRMVFRRSQAALGLYGRLRDGGDIDSLIVSESRVGLCGPWRIVNLGWGSGMPMVKRK